MAPTAAAGPPPKIPKPTGPGALDYGGSAGQISQIAVDQLPTLGLTGRGVVVGVLDAGFAPFSVEALDHAVILGERDFVDRDSTPFETPSHGTSVLSVLGGYAPGQLIGPAYGSSFLLARTEIVEDGIEIRMEEDLWVEGLEWLEREGAEVVNSSLGYSDWYTFADYDGRTAVTTVAADAAVERGVFIANSVGNEGTAGLTAPADGFHVCAVGAVTATGIPWSGSSRGPTADGRTKPDVAALGVSARLANSIFPGRLLFDSSSDPRTGPVDFTARYVVPVGRTIRTFLLALTLTDDDAAQVAWLGRNVGGFSGLAVTYERGGATRELWVNDFSDPTVLSAPRPEGFGYEGETLRFQNGGIETTLANRFNITLLLDLSSQLPEGGLLGNDVMAVRTTSNFAPLSGIEIARLDDGDRASYGYGTGTSYASPLVAGAAALILEARPSWTPLEVLAALRTTASQHTTPDNVMGYGIADVYGAVFGSGIAARADLDGDGSVGILDLYLFRRDWESVHGTGGSVSGSTLRSDLNLDGRIDGADTFILSGQWLAP